MKPLQHICILVLFMGISIYAEKQASTAQPHPWTHLTFNNDARNFQFVIVSDRTGGCRAGVFASAVQKINELQPEFVISVGDLIQGYTRNKDEILRQWDEFDTLVNHLEMPFFYIAGNHDMTNEPMRQIWQERLGERYYHFVYQNVLFLCLDSEDPPRKADAFLSDDQIGYFKKVLKQNQQVHWTLVFLHKPMWEYERPTRQSWMEFEKLLNGRDYTVFSGHKHQFRKTIRNGQKYFRLGTTGGGSTLAGPQAGFFDHIVWVTMTPAGPRIANLALNGILDEDPVIDVFADLVNSVTEKIRTGKFLQSPPLELSSEDSGKDQALNMTFRNFAPLPMAISGSFESHPYLDISPENLKKQLPPLLPSLEQFTVSLKKDVPSGSLPPIRFKGSISYSLPGKKPVATGFTHTIPVRAPQPATTR